MTKDQIKKKVESLELRTQDKQELLKAIDEIEPEIHYAVEVPRGYDWVERRSERSEPCVVFEHGNERLVVKGVQNIFTETKSTDSLGNLTWIPAPMNGPNSIIIAMRNEIERLKKKR